MVHTRREATKEANIYHISDQRIRSWYFIAKVAKVLISLCTCSGWSVTLFYLCNKFKGVKQRGLYVKTCSVIRCLTINPCYLVEHNRFSLLYIANFHNHTYIWFNTDPAHTALDLLWLDLGCDVRPGMVQLRGAKQNPARPTSVFELRKFVSVINIICVILG